MPWCSSLNRPVGTCRQLRHRTGLDNTGIARWQPVRAQVRGTTTIVVRARLTLKVGTLSGCRYLPASLIQATGSEKRNDDSVHLTTAAPQGFEYFASNLRAASDLVSWAISCWTSGLQL